mmetsp:Transcript_27093/g.23951  ORF Transcript_27093/g.23951 Transcript_27093/m.23951 type:complete len:96 (+) Transcript_27093:1714-2001(+)
MNFPNLEYLDVLININAPGENIMINGEEKFISKKEYIEENFELLNSILSKSKRLFFVKYNSQLVHDFRNHSLLAKSSRYVQVGNHPISRFIEIIT